MSDEEPRKPRHYELVLTERIKGQGTAPRPPLRLVTPKAEVAQEEEKDGAGE